MEELVKGERPPDPLGAHDLEVGSRRWQKGLETICSIWNRVDMFTSQQPDRWPTTTA